jgi:hypothetical protein
MADGFLKDYEPVEDRLRAFWSEHSTGRVVTELVTPEVSNPGEVVIFRAEVHRLWDGPVSATGYAHQRLLKEPPPGRNGPNTSAPEWTSPWEVAETSAIGRALANLGYAAKGKRPSREEMQKSSGDAGTVTHGGVAEPGGSDAPASDPKREEPSGIGEGPEGSHDPTDEQREAYIQALREGPGLPSAFTMAKALFNTDANKRVRNMRDFHALSVDELFQVAAAFEDLKAAAS